MRKELRPVHDLISCDLCHRTILKGERIETFVGAGDRQRVCELCSLRALRSGWLRECETERQTPDRGRQRGPRRSLWSRAVTWAEEQGLWRPPPEEDERPDDGAVEPAPIPLARSSADDSRPSTAAGASVSSDDGDVGGAPVSVPPAAAEPPAGDPAGEQPPPERPGRPEFDGDSLEADEDGAGAMARRSGRAPSGPGLRDLISGRRRDPREVSAVPTSRWGKIERALELFNASEHRRTISGVGRTLGEPWVSALPLDDGPTAREVGIVVAWELSWYRYRVDLDDADQAVLLLDRGNEVDELDEELRHWNVGADAQGRLTLAIQAVS